MTEATSHLESVFATAWPPAEWRDVHVVLGVSGGADSVALLRLAIAAKVRAGGAGRLFVAHVNHGLRPAEATDDEKWLVNYCKKLDVPLETCHVDVAALAAQQGDGLEAAARQARYEFLRRSSERLGARFVALAHTADDQVETVLQRLVRGTGLAGLAGMPRQRSLSPTATLVRPLLSARRQDVLNYLAEIGQDFRTDASNLDRRFTRNRLRHDLLPLLRSRFNADVDEAVLRLAEQANESQQLVSQLAEELIGRAFQIASGRVEIDCRQLTDGLPLVVREACKLAWAAAGWQLQDMGFREWQQLARLACAGPDPGVSNLPANVRAERRGDRVVISQNP